MNLKEAKAEALKNPSFRQEWERYDLAFEVGQMVLEQRMKCGISQGILAKRVGTHQPAIARLENGNTLPSLTFLNKVMLAMGVQIKLNAIEALKSLKP